MSSATPVADTPDKELSPAESGKILQDPQPPRNKQRAPNLISDSGKSRTKEIERASVPPPLRGVVPDE
jgi:hypothetical protein